MHTTVAKCVAAFCDMRFGHQVKADRAEKILSFHVDCGTDTLEADGSFVVLQPVSELICQMVAELTQIVVDQKGGRWWTGQTAAARNA